MHRIQTGINAIAKVGAFNHVHSLYSRGEVFLNTIDFFKQADKNNARFDKSENAQEIEQVDWIKIQDNAGEFFEFSRNSKSPKLSSAYLLTYDNQITGNIFSCSYIMPSNIDSFLKLNPAFADFGDTCLLIEKPIEFLLRIEHEVKKLGRGFWIQPVNYYDRNKRDGKLTLFDKSDEYSYQCELRIFIENAKPEPMKLSIGSLSPISSLFKMEELLKL